ncbi:hypothetical protein CCHL11_03529 [Colletotrichum chlorophyti]|uniref:Uncharacterized protein n=1 Tax=Colletotrichum chlorophyti TaxID=708187 RepID=A0A1Q8RSC1_9PEZI|nr:hypothetical protein CCHL11_03529 [Colletotrichum chlorophyti]
MNVLKQLDPNFPRERDGMTPRSPENKPLETKVDSAPPKNMKPDYNLPTKNQVFIYTEPASPSIYSDSGTMGLTKSDLVASESGAQNRGPRQALPRGLVAQRYANQPSHHRHQSNSSTSSPVFVDCDLIDLGGDVPSPSNKSSDNGVGTRTNVRVTEVDHVKDIHRQRELEELRQKLKVTTARAEIAEEKAVNAEQRVVEVKATKISSFNEAQKDTGSLTSRLEKLEKENSTLKEQLRDAQSHIFSLQPYRKELTPEEVGREYDDLIEGITDWVAKFMSPFLDDHTAGVNAILSIARRRPTDAIRLKQIIQACPDLAHASMFPETDEDLAIAIILRFLNENIFQRILYGTISNYVEALGFVEGALQTQVEPKRDIFAIRTWTAEAYNAILSSHPFKGCRAKKTEELTKELAGIFKLFCKKDHVAQFHEEFEKNCVVPAMRLYEKIQVSTNHFYFDINPYIMWGSQEGQFQTSPEFMTDLRNLDCRNILQNRKAFNLDKIDPEPSQKELHYHLLNVCTIAPALYMRQIGRKDVIRPPQSVRKQQMLVAWGTQEKRDMFQHDSERTLLSHLYHAQNDRERQEAGGWATFRWSS